MPLIKEDEALSLTNNMARLTPEQQVQAGTILGRYKTQQEDNGMPLFPAMAAREQKNTADFRSMFADPSNVDKVTPAILPVLAGSPDPSADRMRVANTAFMAKYTGQPIDQVEKNYDNLMPRMGSQLWKSPTSDTKAFYALAQKHVQGEVDNEAITNEARMAGMAAAITGDGTSGVADFNAWREKAKDKFTPQSAQLFAHAYNEAAARVKPYKPLVDQLTSTLSSTMNGGTPADAVQVGAMTDQLLNMPGRERNLVLTAAMMKGQADGKELDKGFVQQTGEAFARTIEDMTSTAGLDEAQIDGLRSSIKDLRVSQTVNIKDAAGAQQFIKEQLAPGKENEPGGTTSGMRPLTAEESKLATEALDHAAKGVQLGRQIRSIALAEDPVKNVYANAIGSSAALMGVLAIPGGSIASAAGYTNAEYNKLRQDYPQMEKGDALKVAAVSGGIQSALDHLEFGFIKNTIPSLGSLITGGAAAEIAKRLLVRGAEGFVLENVQEGLQDITTPAVMEVASRLSSDIPQVDWKKEWADWYQGRADVALGTIPLVLLGVGVAGFQDVKGAKAMMSDNNYLGQNGYPEASRVEAVDLAVKGDLAGAQAVLQRDFNLRSPDIAAAFGADEKATTKIEAEQKFTTLQQKGVMPTFTRTNDGWLVGLPDGTQHPADSWTTAKVIAAQHFTDQVNQQVNSVASLADHFMGQQREGLTESTTISPQVRDIKDDVADKIITEEQAREAVKTAGLIAGLTEEQASQQMGAVLGRNTLETQALVQHSASAIYRGANVLTVVEETVEGRYKAGVESGRYSDAQTRKWIALAEEATGEQFLHNDNVTEAVSSIVTADTLGSRKDGTRLPAGLITRGMAAAVQNAAGSKPGAMAKFSTFLSAWRQFFKQTFQRAKALQKAKTEGKLGKDHQAFIDDLMGVDTQGKFDNARAAEAQGMAGIEPSAVPRVDSYSIAPRALAERMTDDLQKYLRDPEKRTAFWKVAQSKLAEVGKATAAANAFKDNSVRQDSARMADAADKQRVHDERIAELESQRDLEVGGARDEGKKGAEVKLIKAGFDKQIQKEKTRFATEQKSTQAANKLADQSDEAKQRMEDMRQSTVAALKTLEAVVSALPIEERGRVGGFAELAKLTTEDARAKYISEKLAKVDKVVERYLRDEFVGQAQKLLKSGVPQGKAGERPGSKIGADASYLFQQAEAAAKMDEAGVLKELAGLDQRIDSGTLSTEEQNKAEMEARLVELVGDLRHADAARAEAAVDALKGIYEGGYFQWSIEQTRKREAREAIKTALIADTGKEGNKVERSEQEEYSGTKLGWTRDRVLSLSSYAEVLHYVFGKDSATVLNMINRERNASNEYHDAVQAMDDKLADFFTQMGGSVIKGEQLRYDLAQKTIDAERAGKLSQLEAIQALMMWRQEDGRRHMEGPRDESNQPVEGKWSYDQPWIDNLEKQITPEARQVMDFLSREYEAEYAALNELYRERFGVDLPHHLHYSPITVVQQFVKSGEIADPVTGTAMNAASLTPGSLRTRSQSLVAEPEFRDALATFVAHTKQLEYWKSYYEVATETQQLFGNRDVLNAVEAAGGAQARKVLNDWASIIARGGVRDAAGYLAASKTINRMASRASTAAILGRVSTLLVQSTQLAAASAQMPTGRFIKSFGKLMTGNLGWGAAVNSAFIQRRMSSMSPLLRAATQELGAATRPNKIKHAVHWLGKALGGIDAVFTAGTYAMILDHQMDLGREAGMTGAELERHAHSEAERLTEEVAQPIRMTQRSAMELHSVHPLARIGWAFASESRQKIALMANALSSEGRADPGRAARVAFLTFVVGGLGAQVLKNLWRMAKGDDDEKMWSAQRMTKALLLAPLTGVPGVSALTDTGSLFSGVTRAEGAAGRVFSGESLDDPIKAMQDVEALLTAMALFSETAAAVAAMSHAGVDAAKILQNLTTEK